MKQIGGATLAFDRKLSMLGGHKALRQGLSVVARIGDSLWLANDEAITLERLTLSTGPDQHEPHFADHRQFALHDYIKLPLPRSDTGEIDEADIEGIDFSGDYLWLVGSHSLKRTRPREEDSPRQSAKRLAKLGRDGNRFLLARIPLVDEDDGPVLKKKVKVHGVMRSAAILRGDATGNDLMDALAEDIHLRPFLGIPGKDNGFDIEGLAVVGERLLLGLRGPVLRGWAVILEVMPIEVADNPRALKLMKFVPDKQPYLKHFIQLDGLGIRDLCVQGEDLLILAGPTMELDGPVKLFRWPGGANSPRESAVCRDDLELLGEIPYGQGDEAGMDHAEGITLLADDAGQPQSLLVVYDSAAARRQGTEAETVRADIFALPQRHPGSAIGTKAEP